MTLRPLIFLIASALLAACASNPYHPYEGGVGYSEVNTAKNRYEVIFYGTSGMDEATAKNFAIRRAAEVGKANGMPYFRIAGSRNAAVTETLRDPDLFPRSPWTGEPRRMTEWEWRREQELDASRLKHATRVVRTPVIRLTVEYAQEDCDACLSVEEKLKEVTEEKR